ncbi:MAG: hypothetical protein NDJ19_00905, partial [Ramlibacter sp.]|nr:hypothetical protein [Ramlibacter sp.]
MAPKLLFAVLHYGVLLLFAASCWGYGRALLARTLRAGTVDPWLAHGLCITAGLGLWICALQLLGIAGLLRTPAIYALAAGGWMAAAHRRVAQRRAAGAPVSLPPKMPDLASAIVLLAASATLGSPLRPPHLWDELSYHLPHAREWAEAGSLVINEWLRYPWFPFNFDLLFAAALLVYDDVMPHLIHAMAGWLVALLLYRIAIARIGRGPACLAALIWLWLTKDDYAGAYIDMGVTLFVLAAYAAFELWREQPGRRAWLALCAFSLGVAIGSKYQALSLLPLLACGIAWIDRRARTWAVTLFWLAVPCAYWYLRNLLITGDPFNPLGGWLFGFFDWNAGDLQYQLQDIGWAHGWPGRVLWPAAAALLMKSAWQPPQQRTALLFCVYAVAVWLASS